MIKSMAKGKVGDRGREVINGVNIKKDEVGERKGEVVNWLSIIFCGYLKVGKGRGKVVHRMFKAVS